MTFRRHLTENTESWRGFSKGFAQLGDLYLSFWPIDQWFTLGFIRRIVFLPRSIDLVEYLFFMSKNYYLCQRLIIYVKECYQYVRLRFVCHCSYREIEDRSCLFVFVFVSVCSFVCLFVCLFDWLYLFVFKLSVSCRITKKSNGPVKDKMTNGCR